MRQAPLKAHCRLAGSGLRRSTAAALLQSSVGSLSCLPSEETLQTSLAAGCSMLSPQTGDRRGRLSFCDHSTRQHPGCCGTSRQCLIIINMELRLTINKEQQQQGCHRAADVDGRWAAAEAAGAEADRPSSVRPW